MSRLPLAPWIPHGAESASKEGHWTGWSDWCWLSRRKWVAATHFGKCGMQKVTLWFLITPRSCIKINKKLCCCCCSITQSRPTLGIPWTAAQQTSLSFTSSWSLLKLMSIEPMMPSNHLSLCHPLILPPSIFPRLGSSLMSQFFASGGQNIGASVSASVLPRNIQDWFPLGLTGVISLQTRGLSSVFSITTVGKHQFFSTLLSLWSNSYIHAWLLEEP